MPRTPERDDLGYGTRFGRVLNQFAPNLGDHGRVMAALLSPRRLVDLTLVSTEAREAREDPAPDGDGPPALPWLLVALFGALATALVGWVVVTGFAVVGWLAADRGTVGDAFATGTQLWLLGSGAGARLGGMTLTLTPLGLSLLYAYLLSRFAGFAVRHSEWHQAQTDQARTVLGIVTVTTAGYLAPVVSATLLTGRPGQAVRGLGGAVAIGLIGSAWGSLAGSGYRPTDRWPAWARPVPRAVLAGVAVLLLAGSVLLLATLVTHVDRIRGLTDSLGAGVVGGIALLALQLAYLPNAVVWSATYGLGAGFSLGSGSVVSPTGTSLGIVPGVPILGALPATGPASSSMLGWLGAGVVAGGVAALVVLRARREARVDEACLVGGLAGALAGLAFTAVAWASTGSLGSHRLVGLGPRLLPTLVASITTLGLAAMIVGLVTGLLRLRRR